jgi:two-component system LytT family response regulator
MGYQFLIVDDEKLNRSFIKNLILDFEPQSTVFDAKSVAAAKQILENNEIDILFLDIKMPEADGFDLLKLFPVRNFELIFVTAYSEYAINAIREGAQDYILKPIKIPEFQKALYRVIDKLKRKALLHSAPEATPTEKLLNSTITIKTQKGTNFVQLKHIIYVQADNTYTTLHLSGGEKVITTKPIIKYEEMLDPKLFFRIHKSYIINLSHFKEHISMNGDWALMDNGIKLTISRYRLKHFLDFLKENPIS